ncbi:alpha/beta hydrolase [Nocardia sp. NBC_01503]|uniref:alpha/beta-hydrolase family protein n=1 Tax=Nocardia sp. NBC_01503 TaxID=2975997 RepID=UPI002E7BBF06|nr:alpha/beta-hydrolase family protein [Nocardia sp. NBC_01503]WTL32983.1 alpha/beta hydrolase [Nocardia sp. NBC_01503]
MSIIDRARPTTTNSPGAAVHDSRANRSIGARLRIRAPRVGTTLGVLFGVLASLAPGLLPRTPTAQAILTALLVLLGLGVVGLGRIALRRMGFGDGSIRRRSRVPVLALAVPAVAVAVAQAEHWQNRLRGAMGVAQVGPAYWLLWGVWTALIVGAVICGCLGIRRVVRRLGRLRSALLLAMIAVATQAVLVPTVVDWRKESYAAANAYVDPTLQQPVSPGRSGSPVSAASWSSLGAQGRKFVAGQPAQGVRVYIGLNSAPDVNARVALAIQELERSGGLQRANLVVTVPTGSGWIDGEAAAGLDRRFDGDVALVGLQYSNAPSWATFVFGRSAAEESARALFTAVEQRVSTLPHRPKLYLYGQSLGALGGNAIFADDADQDRRTCAALWAGPPANDVHRAGATVLANASDPVVHWSPSLLWSPPNLTGTRPDAPVPRWLPVVSFLQTSLDLLGALDAPSGHGHRYGVDQGTALGTC